MPHLPKKLENFGTRDIPKKSLRTPFLQSMMVHVLHLLMSRKFSKLQEASAVIPAASHITIQTLETVNGSSMRLVSRFVTVKNRNDGTSGTARNGTEDKKNEIQELAKETVKEMYRKAKEISDPEIRKTSMKHAQNSQGKRSIQNMISMSSSDRSININAEDLDTYNWLLNIENGTLDLETGKLFPHDPNHLISKIANVKFDENAECPKWKDFLNYLFDGDKELIGYMQKLTGYCLTGSTKQQILPILYGTGNNGKTTFMQVLEGLLGEYCIYADVSSFVASNNSSIRNDLARMKGSRLILTSEFEHNQHISEATVKSATGGEKIPCRYLYGEYFEYRPTGKIMMATNYKPLIKGTDVGIWRRIHFIPFVVQIAEVDRKENYHEELLEELPGILNWALEGCLKWQKEGLKKPPSRRCNY